MICYPQCSGVTGSGPCLVHDRFHHNLSRRQLMVAVFWCVIQWIGLREKMQETTIFHGQIYGLL